MKIGNIVTIGAILFAPCNLALANCDQLLPNPNPLGNTINNTSTNGCNELALDNFGTVNNLGVLYSSAPLSNYGNLNNYAEMEGAVENYGKITNYSDLGQFHIGGSNNYGELVNYGSKAIGISNNRVNGVVSNFGTMLGYTQNSGRIENFGTLKGLVENEGTLNNNLGATLKEIEIANIGTFNNNGFLQSNTQFESRGTVNNNGRIESSNHIINSVGGTLNNKTNGVIASWGSQLDNSGIFNNDGIFDNSAVFYNVGTINNNGRMFGNTLINPGVLVNSQDGVFDLPLSNLGHVDNYGTMNARSVGGSGVLNNSGTLNTEEIDYSGELTNSGAITNSIFVANNGRLSILAGGTMTGSGAYYGESGATVVDGSMILDSVAIYAGILKGSGNITSATSINGGTLAPGSSIGTLTINGDLAFNNGTLEIEIGSAGFDLLKVFGTTSFAAGEIQFSFLDSFMPQFGDHWLFLSSSGGVAGWENLRLSFLGADGYSFVLTEWNGNLILSVDNGIAPVPEPETYAMMLAGLGLLGVMARRRKHELVAR